MRDGLIIPPSLNSPHAVSFLLNQKRGHLQIKHAEKGLHTTQLSSMGR